MRIGYFDPFEKDPLMGIDPEASIDRLGDDQHRQAIQAWVDAPLADRPNLLLVGPTGTGKTFAAHAIARVFHLSEELGHVLGLTERGHVAEYQRLGFHIFVEQAQVIILDELGAGYAPGSIATTETRQALRALLDMLGPRRLIVTTTLSSQQIADIYGEDIASRIAAGPPLILRFEGPDRRTPAVW